MPSMSHRIAADRPAVAAFCKRHHLLATGCLLLLVPALAAASDARIDRTFKSPDGSCSLRYVGAERGEGTWEHVGASGARRVYSGYHRYGPIVSWVSNDVAEIRLPSGSPIYTSFFYDCARRRLSPEYLLPIAVDATRGTVATLDDEAVRFFSLFTQQPVHAEQVPRLEPAGFLVFCEPKAQFRGDGSFFLRYTCPQQPLKTLEVGPQMLRTRR